MSHLPACPSPAHQRPSDSLAAPAVAGQGVGTISPHDQHALEAMPVLSQMLAQRKFGSPEYEALLTAITEIQLRLLQSGFGVRV